MKLEIGGMDFSFESADRLLLKLKAAAEKLDKKISACGELKKRRSLILKALKEFRENSAQSKGQ
jgi:hypothetical protein